MFLWASTGVHARVQGSVSRRPRICTHALSTHSIQPWADQAIDAWICFLRTSQLLSHSRPLWAWHSCQPVHSTLWVGDGTATSLGFVFILSFTVFWVAMERGCHHTLPSDGGRDDQLYESTCKVSRVLKKASTFCPSVALKESERKERSLWWPTRLNCKARQYGD